MSYSFSDSFRGYRPLTEAQVKEAWAKATFCLDTNFLLDLYRYSDDSRDEFLKVLDRIKNRLFVPARIADEFARNRPNAIRFKFAPHRHARQ